MPPDAPAPDGAPSPGGVEGGEAEAPSVGALQDRNGDFEKMWSEARQQGADDDVKIGLDDHAKIDASAIPRDKDGKFLKGPKVKKAEPKPGEAPPGAPKPAAKPAVEGSLAEAHRLAKEGDYEGAIRIALGIDITEVDEAQLRSPHFRELRRRESAAKKYYADADARIAGAREEARQLMPLVEARKAYHSGNLEAFIQHATGDSLVNFLRKIAGGPASPQTQQADPALRRVQELEQKLQQREQADAERTQAEKVQAYKDSIGEDLTELAAEDPRFERLATKKQFIEAVFSVQERHWRKGKTLPVPEAADIAFEELYGDVVQATSPRSPRNGATSKAPGVNGAPRGQVDPGGAATNGRAGGRPRTGPALSHTTSAEAAPSLDMSRFNPETFADDQQKVWSEIERHVRAEARNE